MDGFGSCQNILSLYSDYDVLVIGALLQPLPGDAALAPLYLGVKAVVVKSFARIHRSNLINAGILPLTFVNEEDYDSISQGDELSLPNVRQLVSEGKNLVIINKTTGKEIPVECELSGRTRDIILAGGLLDYTKQNS